MLFVDFLLSHQMYLAQDTSSFVSTSAAAVDCRFLCYERNSLTVTRYNNSGCVYIRCGLEIVLTIVIYGTLVDTEKPLDKR